MACRLINLHDHALRVDLRGGTALLLAPGEQTPALRDELLYDNDHLAEWERAGWVRRLPARMSDVLAAERAAPAPKAAAAPAQAAPAPASRVARTSVRPKAARR